MNTDGEERLPFRPRLKRLARRTIKDWGERSVGTYASSIAFFFSISVIPMIILLLQFLPLAGLSQLELLRFIEQLIPEALYGFAARVGVCPDPHLVRVAGNDGAQMGAQPRLRR